MAKTKFIDLGNKPLPANEEMEEIVLATIFSWKGFIFRVMNIIKPVMFYNDKLRNIMSSYFKVLNNNKDVTPLLLYEQIVKDKHKNVLEIYTEPRLFVSYWADIQFKALISADIFDDYCCILAEKYLRRKLIEISYDYANDAYDESIDIFEIYEKIINDLEKTKFFNSAPTDFKYQVEETIAQLKEKREGNVSSYYKLYDERLASFMQLKPDRILLLPSDKGAGKTSFLSWLVEGIVELNPQTSVIWFCFEDSKQEMILKFISRKVKLTVKELNSVDYTLTEKDINNIDNASQLIQKYNIEFIDQICDVYEIKRHVKRFKERHKGKEIIVIIDNFGLIDRKKHIGDDIEKDKLIVSEINSIRKELSTCMIIPHHITKEFIGKEYFKDGYRIRDKGVKGPGEVLNYFPQCYPILRPGMYTDIVDAYKSNISCEKYSDNPTQDDFENDIWRINSDGDLIQSWISLKVLLTSKSEFDENGRIIDYSYIVGKYKKYVTAIKNKNLSREDRYKSKIKSFSVYLTEKMYMQNDNETLPPFDEFFYGKLAQRPDISRLFIVESIRDRYNNFSDKDKAVFRYIHQLEYNDFIPL